MQGDTKDLNIVELLMGIKEDVASIKADMANFKESQKAERDNISKEIADVRIDNQRQISDLETRLTAKISNMQSVSDSLVNEVNTLKQADDDKDAKKWRMAVRLIITALAGMLLAKIPDFVSFLLKLHQAGGN